MQMSVQLTFMLRDIKLKETWLAGKEKLGLDKIELKFLSGNIVTCHKRHFPRLFFPNKVYENLVTARSYSDKRGIEYEQKSSV